MKQLTDAEREAIRRKENIKSEKQARERIGRNIYDIVALYNWIVAEYSLDDEKHEVTSKEKLSERAGCFQNMGKAFFEILEDYELLKSLKM